MTELSEYHTNSLLMDVISHMQLILLVMHRMTYLKRKVDLLNSLFNTLQWIPIELQIPTIARLCIGGLLTLARSPDPLCLPHIPATWPSGCTVDSRCADPQQSPLLAVHPAHSPTDIPLHSVQTFSLPLTIVSVHLPSFSPPPPALL